MTREILKEERKNRVLPDNRAVRHKLLFPSIVEAPA